MLIEKKGVEPVKKAMTRFTDDVGLQENGALFFVKSARLYRSFLFCFVLFCFVLFCFACSIILFSHNPLFFFRIQEGSARSFVQGVQEGHPQSQGEAQNRSTRCS